MRKAALFFIFLFFSVLSLIQRLPAKSLTLEEREWLESFLTIPYDYAIYFTVSPDDFVPPLSKKEMEQLKQKLVEHPEDAALLYKMGKIVAAKKEKEESDPFFLRAEKSLKDKIKKGGGGADDWLLLCKVEAALGRGKETLASCERASERLPHNGEAAIKIAEQNLGNQNIKEAIVWAERAVRAEPQNLSFRGMRYLLHFFRYLFQGGYGELEKEGFPVQGLAERFQMANEEKSLLEGGSDEAIVWRTIPEALLLLLRFRWKNALANPAKESFHFLDERGEKKVLQRSEEALFSIQQKPNIVFALLGILKVVEGEQKEAEELLKKALRKRERDPQYYEYLLFSYSVFGEYEKAKKVLQKKMKKLGKRAKDTIFLAKLDSLEENWKGAEKQLKALLKASPRNPSAKYGMAMVYLHKKRWEAAEKILKSLEVREHGQDVYLPLGIMELLRNRRKEAKHYLEKSSSVKKNRRADIVLKKFF